MSKEVTLPEVNLPDDRILLSQTGVYQFNIGMKIRVEYVNPTAGWSVIWVGNDKNIALTFSARIDEKDLVLNSRIDGNWGIEERPSGYDFTPGVSQNVSLEAEQDYIIIRVNNNDLHHFKYRLPATSINRVVVMYRKSGSAAATKLNAVSYNY